MPKRRHEYTGKYTGQPTDVKGRFEKPHNTVGAAPSKKKRESTEIAKLAAENANLEKQLEADRRVRVDERTWQIAQLAVHLLPKIHEGVSGEERREIMPSVIEDAEFLLEAARLRSSCLWAHQLFEDRQSEMLTAGQIATVFSAHNWRGWMEDNTVRQRIEDFANNPPPGRRQLKALGLSGTAWLPDNWITCEPSGEKSVTKYDAYSILRTMYLEGTLKQKALVRKPNKLA